MAPRSMAKVRPKKSYFSSAWEYVKLPFSLRVPKNMFFINFQSLFTFVSDCISRTSLNKSILIKYEI
jgi:hypothetical protein